MPLLARRILIFACTHALVTLGLTLYAIWASSAEFDDPALPRGAQAAGTIAGVLLLPGRLLWTTWASKNLPNLFEWVLFLANSMTWALLFVGATSMLPGRRSKAARR